MTHGDDHKKKVPEAEPEVQQQKPKVEQEPPKVEPKSQTEPPQEPPKVEPQAETPTTSSWRSWGAFSVISNASKTVASITTHVSQSIIDSINIPDPEEMARMQVEDKKNQPGSEDGSVNDSEKSEESRSKLDNFMSGVSQISSKVVSGGLDTLEGIGKKTINILQETDPNIKEKIRNMNVSNKPNLSDLLKEAKDRDEVSPTRDTPIKTVSFEHLLDEYKGLVFLEALEILSNQSKMQIEITLKPLSGRSLAEMQETIDEIEELCDFDPEVFDESLTIENLEKKIKAAKADLNIELNTNEIVNHAEESQLWLDELNALESPKVIYEKSIHVLAKSCALSLNNFQKLAELLLSQDHRQTADEADSMSQLAKLYCSLFNHLAVRYTEEMTSGSANDENKKMATNVFLEVSFIQIVWIIKNDLYKCSPQSSHAITHVKKAFNLFIPILQIGAI